VVYALISTPTIPTSIYLYSSHSRYIVGTDDGHIHRCSCSLYEQYLATHYGHTSPVYRLRWSPFLSGAFLSCSADWTVRLWHQDYEAAVFKFQSGKDTIADIAWSPSSSTVFGCVSSDGRMEIWDLSFSVYVFLSHLTIQTRPCNPTYSPRQTIDLHNLCSEFSGSAGWR
jgi:WD40 repeat protein